MFGRAVFLESGAETSAVVKFFLISISGEGDRRRDLKISARGVSGTSSGSTILRSYIES